ncbi:hypothetical protein PYE51_07660 [Vibrio aestuarianus]|uniref:Uncharacterized protein n=1 Tax=Vibrio aestuarianus TaxID=28171 RepID=A0AAX3TZ78_9VIBR|nr:hypothetical protein [Vibrio aestuarianus]WGK80549.1 hypothetical protein PYE51_07660 [Vibrio aestuarianus]
MNNAPEQEKPFTEQHDYEVLLDSYHQLKVDELVINHCIDKGFITQLDIATNARKYVLLKGVIATTLHSFKLVDTFDDKNITKHNIDAYFEHKRELAKRVTKVVSERLLAGLSDFRH